MFGIAPRWAHRGDIGVGAFAEAGNAVVLRALGFRVATDHQNLAQLGRLDPGIRKRQVACAAKPEFGALAVLRKSGRASCRERVCQYVSISVVAVSLNRNNHLDCTDTKLKTYTTIIQIE